MNLFGARPAQSLDMIAFHRKQGLEARGYGVFHVDVVRTFRSAVSGRPEGLHYIGVKNALG